MNTKGLALVCGIGIWGLAWWAMVVLEPHWGFANLAMLLMLASTLVAVLLPAPQAALALGVSVLAFNWLFIEPKGSFMLHRQMLGFWLSLVLVNVLVLALMAYLRHQLANSRLLTSQLEQLNQWHQILLENSSLTLVGERFLELLDRGQGTQALPPVQLALKNITPHQEEGVIYCLWGPWQMGQIAGVEAAQIERRPLGPGTGCYERWQDLVLPILGRKHVYGALVLSAALPDTTSRHWLLMCHHLGAFCDRQLARQQEAQATSALQQERTSKAIIAAVSHDFRTPLATIMGASSSLLAQAGRLSTQEQQAQVQRIYQQAQHLSQVSQNLLQLARLGADVQIRCSWEDVGEIAGGLLVQLPFKARVQVQLPQAAPLIWCNSVLLNQALFNLLENAHRHGPQNTPILLAADFTDGVWHWQVQDAGHTLTAEQAYARQQAFTQGQEASHPVGVGLGLALCVAIAKAHGGSLRFTSEPSCTWLLNLPQPHQPAAETL